MTFYGAAGRGKSYVLICAGRNCGFCVSAAVSPSFKNDCDLRTVDDNGVCLFIRTGFPLPRVFDSNVELEFEIPFKSVKSEEMRTLDEHERRLVTSSYHVRGGIPRYSFYSGYKGKIPRSDVRLPI